jgi:glycosyltransferase involved in cell wall biosynthesis
MKYCVVMPAYNEEAFIALTLDSLLNQNLPPARVVVVDDGSQDKTPEIVQNYAAKHPNVSLVRKASEGMHEPGSKVIKAFMLGFDTLNEDWDFIVKADADLIFPPDYFAVIATHFERDTKVGMAGGFAHIQQNGLWVLESLTGKDHIRGAFKAYRKACYQDIGGLQPAMGWDTLDELMAQYHGWKIKTDESLVVKHLKPTGARYNPQAAQKQGQAYYQLGYGLVLTLTSALKLAVQKKKPLLFLDYLQGFFLSFKNNTPYLVGPEERKYIRNYRWKKMREKLGF